MLLDFSKMVRKHKMYARGVIHVGAHYGEEYADYLAAGISKVVFIEPCEKAFKELKYRFLGNPDVRLFNLALGNKHEAGVTMYTSDNASNRGQSNSLLRPAKHLSIHPTIKFDGEELVDVELLDNLGLDTGQYDMLVMDCQGFEGRVLNGGPETLKHINWVYTEVNVDEVYEDCTRQAEIDMLLIDFDIVEMGTLVGDAWSDALYIRKK